MSIQLENFTISRLVIHEIYKRDATGAVPPALNNSLADLDARGIAELQTRIVEAVGHGSHSITMDIVQTDEGSVYSNIAPFLYSSKSNDDFIAMSHRLVNKLVQCQTSQLIPGGIVLVFEGTTGISSKKYMGIIKADKLTGFTVTTANQTTMMQFLNNLLLTPQQKLYKVAIAVRNTDGETGPQVPDDISVAVFDSNNNKASSNAAATYFYDAFLGCTFQRKSDVLTRDFFNYTKEFITKKSGLPGKDKVELMSALYVYIKVRADNSLNVGDFAQEYFHTPEFKDSYQDYMTSKKVPATNIPRDLSMISSKLRKRRIKFSNSVDIYAPVDNFSDNVTILSSEGDSTTLKIQGTIKTEN